MPFHFTYSLLGRLLLALVMLVAVAPPGGLEVCIGEDGHVHFGASGETEGCLCLGDGCACPTDDHGHKDLGLEAVELVQRGGNESLLALLPGPLPASQVFAPQVELEVRSSFVEFDPCTFTRPPQWPAAARTLVLRT